MKKIMRWAIITLPLFLAGCRTMLGDFWAGIVIIAILATASGCKLDDLILIK